MQPVPERPMLSPPSTSTMVGTPPASTRRITPSTSSINEETVRKSLDTVATAKSPRLSKKPVPKRTNSVQVHNYDNQSDETDRDGATSYFDNSPAPSQFLGSRGRPLSFYDMKEQQKQTRPKPAPLNLRNSWRASGEMPYNYADIIGDNRSSYAPPRLGQMPPRSSQRGPPPAATDIYLGLPWTMWMNSEVKNMFVASVGEWVGTTLFLFFAFAGTQVANAHSKTPAEATTTNATAGFSPMVMLYISVAFGFSLMVNVWIFFRISGGLFNPAVSHSCAILARFVTDNTVGNSCFVGDWCGRCHSRNLSVSFTNHWQYHCIGPCSRLVPDTLECAHHALGRDFISAGRLHRSTDDRRAGLYYPHASEGETQIDIHRACGNWTGLVCRGVGGRVLHRWIPQPSTQPRALHCHQPIRHRALDLLGRTRHRQSPRHRLLQIHQDAGIRNGQPRPGRRRRQRSDEEPQSRSQGEATHDDSQGTAVVGVSAPRGRASTVLRRSDETGRGGRVL